MALCKKLTGLRGCEIFWGSAKNSLLLKRQQLVLRDFGDVQTIPVLGPEATSECNTE